MIKFIILSLLFITTDVLASLKEQEDLINKLLPSVITIMHAEKSSRGSGVIIRKESTGELFVLTNDHVCSPYSQMIYPIKNPVTGFSGEAKFFKASPKFDICALKITSFIGEIYTPKFNKLVQKRFNTVITFGSPRPHGILRGDVGMHIGYAEFSSGPGEIYNFCVDFGYSGGPVFNIEGELVGLINAKNTDESDVCESYGVSSSALYDFVLSL